MMKRPHAICRGHFQACALSGRSPIRLTTVGRVGPAVESHLVAHVPCISSLSSPPVQGMSQREPLKPGLDGMGKECLCWVGSVGPNGDSPPECGSLA